LSGQIPEMVANKLGMNSIGINGGFGGSCAGCHKFPSMDPVSLYELANSIVTGDWSMQRGWRDLAIGRLTTVGFDSVTHVGLEYGPNDFRYDRPIGDDSDGCKDTFKGALNHSIQILLRRYPQIRIFLIPPWWMPTLDGKDSDLYPNEAGFYLREYVEAMRRVAELNRIHYIDLWNTSGVSKSNVAEFTSGDETHLSDAGALRRAEMIANFMRTVF
jgi:lysophospholipase L1-like esterase